ncbi:MAG: TonB-dependent copper receptor, partial [Burkholderiaceae bacterium]|nr:TonB-dependent copper receptor [Burkholderiaceae bacterium]
ADAQKSTRSLTPIEVIADVPASPLTFSADPKQPRQPLPASDGADVLKTIPGFSAVQSGGTNGDVVLRGMFGSRLGVLSDGALLHGACGSRMDAPTSYIAPETYDRITLIKGPQSVVNGPGMSAGAVLFERDTQPFDAPGIRFNGSLVGGSFGRNDQNIDLSAGNSFGYARLTANKAHEQDYKDGGGRRVHSQWDKWNADLALGWTPDAHTRLELFAGVGDGYASYPGRAMDGAKFRRDSYGLRFDKQRIGTVLERVQVRLYSYEFDHVMDNYTMRPRPAGMPMASNPRRRITGGNASTTWRWSDRFELVTGVDFQAERHDLRRSSMGGGMGGGMISYTDMPRTPNAHMSTAGLFGELSWFASDTQRVIGGLRIDHASARDKRASSPTAGDKRAKTLPSAFVRYEQDIAEAPVMWYAGLGHVQRFPDFWELISPGQGPAGSVNAFSAIRPEKTTQLDIGAQYKSASLDAWVSAYAGTVSDFILFNYPGAASQSLNVDARIAGAELGARWRLTPQWNVSGSLAYAWGRNASSGKPLPQIPPLEVRLGAEYAQGHWSAGGLWRLVAAQHRYALSQGNVAGKDFGPSGGFGVLSLHGQYAFNKNAKLSVGIDNVLDKKYSEHLNLAGNGDFGFAANTAFNNRGRSVWVRLSVTH